MEAAWIAQHTYWRKEGFVLCWFWCLVFFFFGLWLLVQSWRIVIQYKFLGWFLPPNLKLASSKSNAHRATH